MSKKLLRFNRPPVRRKDTDYRKHCGHRQSEVDGNKRLVSCVQCGTILDPMNELCRIADLFDGFKRDKSDAQRALERVREFLRANRKGCSIRLSANSVEVAFMAGGVRKKISTCQHDLIRNLNHILDRYGQEVERWGGKK